MASALGFSVSGLCCWFDPSLRRTVEYCRFFGIGFAFLSVIFQHPEFLGCNWKMLENRSNWCRVRKRERSWMLLFGIWFWWFDCDGFWIFLTPGWEWSDLRGYVEGQTEFTELVGRRFVFPSFISFRVSKIALLHRFHFDFVLGFFCPVGEQMDALFYCKWF